MAFATFVSASRHHTMLSYQFTIHFLDLGDFLLALPFLTSDTLNFFMYLWNENQCIIDTDGLTVLERLKNLYTSSLEAPRLTET